MSLSNIKRFGVLILMGIVLFSSACRKEQRDVLFEMTYPNLEFEVIPGISGSQALVFSYPAIDTKINSFLTQNNATLEDIGSIQPLRARIETTDGRSLYFLQRAEIRVCNTDSSDCQPLFDQAFDASDLNGSVSTSLDLIPGLKARTDLLTSDYFKLEIILYLNIGTVTPYNVKGRANVTFAALKK